MSTRRRIRFCRTVFVLFGFLPVLCVTLFAAFVRSPRYVNAQREEWEATLSKLVGLSVQIEKLAYPSPDVAELQGVKVCDPESGVVLAVAKHLELTKVDAIWTASLDYLEVPVETIHILKERLDSHWLRLYPHNGPRIEFTCPHLTMVGARKSEKSGRPSDSFTIDLSGHIEAKPEQGPIVDAQFKLVGTETEKPLRLVVRRERDQKEVATIYSLDTSGLALPCSFLLPFQDWRAVLGEKASVEGALTVRSSSVKKTESRFVGDFHDVDLASLVVSSQRLNEFPKGKLTGEADIAIEELSWTDKEIVEARGQLKGSKKGGRISKDYVEDLKEKLDLIVEKSPDNDAKRLLIYELVAFDFRWQKEGVWILGRADSSKPGVVFALRQRDILSRHTDDEVRQVALHVPANPSTESTQTGTEGLDETQRPVDGTATHESPNQGEITSKTSKATSPKKSRSRSKERLGNR